MLLLITRPTAFSQPGNGNLTHPTLYKLYEQVDSFLSFLPFALCTTTFFCCGAAACRVLPASSGFLSFETISARKLMYPIVSLNKTRP